MNVALLGFGTVGQSVARIVRDAHPQLRITHVFNRNVARKRVDWLGPDVVWTDDVERVLSAPVDVVVEVIGGVDPAGVWLRRAIESGRHVVTANKQLLAQCGADLLAAASARRVHLGFEAAVAGGIPVIRAIREGLAGDRLVCLAGILNGTCNYVLTRMEAAGTSFADALAEAQARGFAEADPTDDVDGYDARAKLCILARVGLRREVRPEQIRARSIRPVDGIDFRYADRLGATIRQVSRAALDQRSGGLVAWVQPSVVARTSPLARVLASQNLVLVTGEHGGETAYSGFGAGGGPTAVAVVSDLVAIAAGRGGDFASAPPVAPAEHVTDAEPSPHYVRFIVRDRPGIIASLALVLSEHGINIDAVLQEPNRSKDALPFVITLEECDPSALHHALDRIAALDFHVAAPLAMPMLDGASAA